MPEGPGDEYPLDSHPPAAPPLRQRKASAIHARYLNTGALIPGPFGVKTRPRTVEDVRWFVLNQPEDIEFDVVMLGNERHDVKLFERISMEYLALNQKHRLVVSGPDPLNKPTWHCYVGWHIGQVSLWETRQSILER